MAIKSLRQQAKEAPKYALQVSGLGLYVSATQGLSGCALTSNESEAMQYSIGFDNPIDKAGIWAATIKRQLGLNVVELIVKNL